VTGPACSEAATGGATVVMTGATGGATVVMTGATGGATVVMTGATGGATVVMTGATVAMTGATGVVAGPGCSGNREPDDQDGHGAARTVP
jgi:hypothetical protein